MSEFEFFMGFYSLLLGLAVAELLHGVGNLVRGRHLQKIGLQTGLLSLLLLIAMCATWVDAWQGRDETALYLQRLAAPLGAAICYYLAAVMLFPKDIEEWKSLDDYFTERKAYIMGLVLGAEVCVALSKVSYFQQTYAQDPDVIWRWIIPYTVTIQLVMLSLIFVRSRRLTIGLLGVLILLFLVPYWVGGTGQKIADL